MRLWAKVARLAVWLPALCGVACAGKAIDSGSGAAGASGNLGRAGVGGVAGSAGLAGTIGGTGGAAAVGGNEAGGSAAISPLCLPGDTPPFDCIHSCADDAATQIVAPSCAPSSGTWLCPSPFVNEQTCPENSCVRQSRTCADLKTCALFVAPCGVDGLLEQCPAGSNPYVGVCIPDGIHTSDCLSLRGEPCSLDGASCVDERVGVCTCGVGPAGLLWTCAVNVL